MQNVKSKVPIFSWALYDLANQFFALNVVSLYLPRWLALEKGTPEIFYSISFGASLFLIALCAPVLGAISDVKKNHREFLIYLTFISVIFTMAMGLVSSVVWVLVFFAIANFGCQGAIIFYNALMSRVAPSGRLGFVSGLGRMFGYTGAILALYFTRPVIVNMGYQPVFLITAFCFLIFSLPCMIFVKEEPSSDRTSFGIFFRKERVGEAFERLKRTLFSKEKYAPLRDFLKAAFFGLSVVNTLILFMAVYGGKVFNLNEGDIINLVALSTLFAIIGSISSGVISDAVGYRRSLIGVFVLWTVCILAGGLSRRPFHWLIGALSGFSMGATWVVARAFVVKLVPQEKHGEVFGLFNIVSYISGIVGPLFWGGMILLLSRFGVWGYRITLLSLLLFLARGFVYLLRIKI